MRAANKGLTHAESRGIPGLLLNDDAALRPGALEKLCQAVERHPNAQAPGPVLVGPKGVESAGMCFPQERLDWSAHDVPSEDRSVMALSGACVLVRSSCCLTRATLTRWKTWSWASGSVNREERACWFRVHVVGMKGAVPCKETVLAPLVRRSRAT